MRRRGGRHHHHARRGRDQHDNPHCYGHPGTARQRHPDHTGHGDRHAYEARAYGNCLSFRARCGPRHAHDPATHGHPDGHARRNRSPRALANNHTRATTVDAYADGSGLACTA
jgi:hypothetical protein